MLAATNLVVTQHEGVTTLMARIGNGRLEPLVDATVRMSALLRRETREGVVFRGSRDLLLERDHIPIFALTWTLFHPIDAASPLFGLSQDELRATMIRLYVIVEARDPVLASAIHEVKDWGRS